MYEVIQAFISQIINIRKIEDALKGVKNNEFMVFYIAVASLLDSLGIQA